MTFVRFGLAALALAGACFASPMPMELSPLTTPETDLLVQRGIELAARDTNALEKRLSTEFSMDRSWKNQVLFGGNWNETHDDVNNKFGLSLSCLDCHTSGRVTAKLWEDLFHPSIRLDFSGVEAYVFLGLEVSGKQTFSVNLYTSNSPIGLGFPGLNVGIVFFVDLVFALDQEVDLTGGFYVKVPDGSFLEAGINGNIKNSFFNGISSQALPVTVYAGMATFKADLRLRVQAGVETSIPTIGIGSGALIGVYANIIEFVAVIDSTPTCAVETIMWWDLNVGAYAHLNVDIHGTTLGPVPTVSTTLLKAPTLSKCWLDGPKASKMPTISASTTSHPSASITGSGSSFSAASTRLSVSTSGSVSRSGSATPGSSGSSRPATILSGSYSTTASSNTHITSYSGSSISTTSSAVSTGKPSSFTYSLSNSRSSSGYATYPIYSNSSVSRTASTRATTIKTDGSYAHTTISPSSFAVSSRIPTGGKSSTSNTKATTTGYSSASGYSTATYTITRCAAEGVMNCPSSYQSEVVITRTLTLTSTVKATVTVAASSQRPTEVPTYAITAAQTLEVCPTPIVNTFTPPADVPTAAEQVKAYASSSVAAQSTAAPSTVQVTKVLTSVVSVGYSYGASATSTARPVSTQYANATVTSAQKQTVGTGAVYPTASSVVKAGASKVIGLSAGGVGAGLFLAMWILV